MTTDVEALVEQAEIAQQVAALKAGTTMGGLLVDGANKGLMKDISDPMTLVPLYATATGEPRPVPVWTLEGKNSILLRKNADGTPVFSTKPPANKPWALGTYPCLLAAGHPDRDRYIDMGLGVEPCKGEHLASPYQVEMHMRHRHSQEWKTIQDAEMRARDQRQQDFMELQTRVAQQALNQQQAPRSVSTPAHPNTELPYDANGVSASKTCEKCGGPIEGTDSFAVARHNKNCPAKGGE